MTRRNSGTDEYITVWRRPWRWLVRADRREILDSPVFKHFHDMLRAGEIAPTTVSQRKTTAIVPAEIAKTDCDLIVKNYVIRHWYQRTRSWFRRMVGVKELRLGRELLRRGIPASVPVAVGERRSLGMVRRCFVAVERIPDTTDFELYALNVEPESLDADGLRARRKAVRNLGALLRRLHDEGVYQYDCNPCNFLINPGTLEITFIDLAKVRIYRKLPRHRALENLAKLARRRELVPVTDAVRFIEGYVGGGRERKAQRFELFRQAERFNRRIVRSDVERGGGRSLKPGRNFARVFHGARMGVFNKTGNKLDRYNGVLLSNLFESAREATHGGDIRRACAGITYFGKEIQTEILAAPFASLKFVWQRKNMLLRSGLSGEMPLALIGYRERDARLGFLFSVPDAVPVNKRAPHSMAFLGLRRPPLMQEESSDTKISYARDCLLEELRGIEFYPPPDGVDFCGEWFALRRDIGGGRLVHLAVRLGGHRKGRCFRLEIGVGGADKNYEQLQWCPGEPGESGEEKKPFSEAVLETGWACFRQKFRNLFTSPERWNFSACDTFYYDDLHQFEIGLERAVALARKHLPGYIGRLDDARKNRNDFDAG